MSKENATSATADDTAYGTFELDGGIVAQINSSWSFRVYRDELFSLQVDGTLGSAVAGLRECRTQHRVNTPRPVWNPDIANPFQFREHWQDVPDNQVFDNGFKVQWEMFLRHVAEDAPFPHDFLEGARGVQLAELGLKSWRRAPLDRCAGAGSCDCGQLVKLVRRRWIALSTTRPLVEPLAPPRAGGFETRVAFAAAHVVVDPLRTAEPLTHPVIDWDATLAYREYLWSLGFGVAEAMDTAQRGMGLDWPLALELIRRSTAAAKARGAWLRAARAPIICRG